MKRAFGENICRGNTCCARQTEKESQRPLSSQSSTMLVDELFEDIIHLHRRTSANITHGDIITRIA